MLFSLPSVLPSFQQTKYDLHYSKRKNNLIFSTKHIQVLHRETQGTLSDQLKQNKKTLEAQEYIKDL